MASSRSYNLLCPISRALDHVGDRWTLLILRDLHAGPARFKDLQTGLTGIASNLLTDRLQSLEAGGLVQKTQSEFGTSLYSLTPQGAKTDQLLFELARIGGQFPHPSKFENLAISEPLQSHLERPAKGQSALTTISQRRC